MSVFPTIRERLIYCDNGDSLAELKKKPLVRIFPYRLQFVTSHAGIIEWQVSNLVMG
jgi:hypothetical protein